MMIEKTQYKSEKEWQEAWRQKFDSEPPKITLKARTRTPDLQMKDEMSKLQTAAARTCYSPRVVEASEITDNQMMNILAQTYNGGHHTVFQHDHFTFGLEGISRQFVWSVLHDHPFSNSEQSSQRSVRLDEPRYLAPKFKSEKASEIYRQAMLDAWQSYRDIAAALNPIAQEEYLKIFPGRRTDLEKRTESPGREKKARNVERSAEKKAIEVARYVVPISAMTQMLHTVSGLVLARLYRLSDMPGAEDESHMILGRMVNLVAEVEPLLAYRFDNPITADELLEHKTIAEFSKRRESLDYASQYARDFDQDMDGKPTKLVGWMENAEKIVASAVRAQVGALESQLSDADAIDLILNPAKNRQLADKLNLTHTAKLSRALGMVTYTWKTKMSHTGDSQAQRHRMTPGAKPLLELVIPAEPDYEMPALIKTAPENIKEMYHAAMERAWNARNRLIELGESVEHANYVLPNATSLRYYETADFLNFNHKMKMRTCLNAQEEIWRSSLIQIRDVQARHPLLGRYLGPPCYTRHLAKTPPVCPEGAHFCGIPMWRALDGEEKYSLDSFYDKRKI
ncbi:FAD-dependent thymidylate synthase [Candidatus Woesearchaeota archaeon]|nr:FAD-dependent thymidylate synthase [Candidatus Woesearchaeota archaeon]